MEPRQESRKYREQKVRLRTLVSLLDPIESRIDEEDGTFSLLLRKAPTTGEMLEIRNSGFRIERIDHITRYRGQKIEATSIKVKEI